MEVGSSTLPGTTLRRNEVKAMCIQAQRASGTTYGGLAQLARAPALQAGGQRFESVILHSADTKVTNETANETFNVSMFQPFNFRNRSMTCWENEKLELQI